MTAVAVWADHPTTKSCRLHDILHSESRLTLVLEYAEKDLKEYMNSQRDLLLREPFLAKVCTSKGPIRIDTSYASMSYSYKLQDQ